MQVSRAFVPAQAATGRERSGIQGLLLNRR